jgi:hypothetical protein
MLPDLFRTMADILYNQERLVKEELLGFRLAHVMLFDAFSDVTFVPFKPFGAGGVIRTRSMSANGTKRTSQSTEFMSAFGGKSGHRSTPGEKGLRRHTVGPHIQ